VTVRIVNVVGPQLTALLDARFGAEVDVVELAPDAPFDDALEGEILLAPGRAAGRPDARWLVAVAERGVRWLHVAGANAGDLPDECFAGGRVVTCSRGAMASPISEFVLASMLAFEKRFPHTWIDDVPADGGWGFSGVLDPARDETAVVMAPPPHWGYAELGTLAGKVLGIFGFGSIGRATAEKALPFGVTVLAVRRTPAPSDVPGVELVGDLLELAAAADHLVLCAPGTPTTRHAFGEDALARTKPTAHLVSVGRGTVVDQEALRRGLDEGRLAFASLDVADPEPLPAGHWLYTHPRVHLSPHVSWCSPVEQRRTGEIILENVRRYLAGERLHGTVDPSERY
jgi:phosphoglycerate dehydrogenase-like enzyme